MIKLAALDSYESIGVVGLGQTGLSVVRYLLQRDIHPVIFDTREQPPGLTQIKELDATLEVYTGPLELEKLLGMDLLIVSPGIDRRQHALQLAFDAAIPVVGDIDLFARHANKPVLGITGSNGKTTVTQLLTAILEAAGMRVGMGGNIGIPVLELVGQPVDVFVLELSSFQLEIMHDLHLHAATILNVSGDHLDRYTDIQAYTNAKHRIYSRCDTGVWNRDDEITAPATISRKHQITFGFSDPVLETQASFGLTAEDHDFVVTFQGQSVVKASELQLTGVHNLLNIQAALALAYTLGVEPTDAVATVKSFRGLPHRCEFVGEFNGVKWVNDSKATNIGATEAAIHGVRQLVPGKLILIAGGDGKGADFSHLKAALKQVDIVIVLGKDGERIANQVEHAVRVVSLAEAVAAAAELATPGSMVMLSPACASLDMFSNYEQRGDQFKAAVEAYHDG